MSGSMIPFLGMFGSSRRGRHRYGGPPPRGLYGGMLRHPNESGYWNGQLMRHNFYGKRRRMMDSSLYLDDDDETDSESYADLPVRRRWGSWAGRRAGEFGPRSYLSGFSHPFHQPRFIRRHPPLRIYRYPRSRWDYDRPYFDDDLDEEYDIDDESDDEIEDDYSDDWDYPYGRGWRSWKQWPRRMGAYMRRPRSLWGNHYM